MLHLLGAKANFAATLNFMMLKKHLLAFGLLFLALACDNPKEINTSAPNHLRGTGSITFSQHPSLQSKPLEAFYHVPENLASNRPILIVFHGASRNAEFSRDALIAKANTLQVAVLVPWFTDADYPGGDTYNLANIFSDGDNPSAQSLNPKEQWTFSVIEPLFYRFKELTGLSAPTFDILGFSAGGQVAHRFGYFWPEAPSGKVVAASSGWYTVPNVNIDFPYGLGQAPSQNLDLDFYFNQALTVLVGTADDNPNAPSLRRNSLADAQGTNRLARAQYFFQESGQLAQQQNLNFTWQYKTLNNVDHSFTPIANYAMDLLY